MSPRHSTVGRAAAATLVTTVLLTACAPATTVRTGPPDPQTTAAEHVVAGSLGDRTGAYLTVVDAASRVEIRTAALPGLLYRISTPAGSGLAPEVTGSGGRVRVGLRRTGDAGPDVVTILLSRRVGWDIRVLGGAGEQHLDLRSGRVRRLDLGSSGLVNVALPEPVGTVPVRVVGAVGDVNLSGPVPVRVSLRKGAASVVTPWSSLKSPPWGTVLVPPGWIKSQHRYSVYAGSTVGRLTVAGPATS
jgi:hypothetical protein